LRIKARLKGVNEQGVKTCYTGFHSSSDLGSPEPGTLAEASSLSFSLSEARAVLGVPERAALPRGSAEVSVSAASAGAELVA